MATRTAAEIAADLENKSKSKYKYKKSPRRLREKLLSSGVPEICAAPCCSETENLEVDHIVPRCAGGTHELENLQFLCGRHNKVKGSRTDFNMDRDFYYRKPTKMGIDRENWLCCDDDYSVVK